MSKFYFDPVTDLTGARNRANETPYTIERRHRRIELRHVPPAGKKKRRNPIPVLLVPPLAGNVSLFDIHPDYSAIRVMQRNGFEQYLLNWGNPTHRDRGNSIDDYVGEVIRAVKLVRKQTGAKKVSLVGYCLGGILAAFYAARSRDVHCLAVLNSPFNFASESLADDIQKAFYDLPRLLTFGLFSRKQLPLRNTSGHFTTIMYQLSNPAAAIRGRVALYRGCLNKHETEVRLSMQEALQMTNYPAQAMQDMIDCALGNQIVEKTMKVRGAPIDLARIRAPIFCGSGKADTTVPLPALLCNTRLISPRRTTTYEAEGGHIGAVFGTASLHSTWQAVADWIKAV